MHQECRRYNFWLQNLLMVAATNSISVVPRSQVGLGNSVVALGMRVFGYRMGLIRIVSGDRMVGRNCNKKW